MAKHISWINDKIGYILVEPELDQDSTEEPVLTETVETSTGLSLETEGSTEASKPTDSIIPSGGKASQRKAITSNFFLGLFVIVLNY